MISSFPVAWLQGISRGSSPRTGKLRKTLVQAGRALSCSCQRGNLQADPELCQIRHTSTVFIAYLSSASLLLANLSISLIQRSTRFGLYYENSTLYLFATMPKCKYPLQTARMSFLLTILQSFVCYHTQPIPIGSITICLLTSKYRRLLRCIPHA